ncbi:MAG: hypothetical protein ACOCWC_05705 [Bacteroidota bacterium]
MPRLTSETKEEIKKLSPNKLQEIVLKLAAKDKTAYDFIFVNYLDKDYGEQDLYEEAKEDLNALFFKGYMGRSEQLRMANKLIACIKRVNEFTKTCNNKKLEADLLVYILKEPFSMPADFFGTCFTKFDSKVAQIVKRLITIITKKLHEDYKADYYRDINHYLQILHNRSQHINMVYNMPDKI